VAVLFLVYTMAYATLTEKLLGAIDRAPSDRAVMLRVNGRWEPMSSGEFLRRIAGSFLTRSNSLASRPETGSACLRRTGLNGTSPISPSSGWGAIDVPIYFNESPDRIVYILNHSGAEIVFVAERHADAPVARMPHTADVGEATSSAPPRLRIWVMTFFVMRRFSRLRGMRPLPSTGFARLG